MDNTSNNPLKRRLKRILDLRLGENEELINGLVNLNSIESISKDVSEKLVKEILSYEGQNKCRSLQFSIYKYHLLIAEKCVDSLKPFIDNLKNLNSGICISEKYFNDSIITPIVNWHKYTFPLLEEFKNIEEDILAVDSKRNICNTLLSRLSTTFVSDIKSIRSTMNSIEDVLKSIVAIYNKCLISECNSKKLIIIFDINNEEKCEIKDTKLFELKNELEYSNMIPQIVVNLKALVLDLEFKRNQLADEIISIITDQIQSKSTNEFVYEEVDIFESKVFLESIDILMFYHKELYCSLLYSIMEFRSKNLEYRFNNIIGHGISANDSNYSSNLLDYLSSIFEWISVCGISIEVEFLTKSLGYKYDQDCIFEERNNEFNQFLMNIKDVKMIDYFSLNFLNLITSILCIPFSGAIRDILRQFHPPQASRPDSTHHFGNLTSLKTGITIGIKIAHLIDNYIKDISPMYKLIPRYGSNVKVVSNPLLIQKFRDLKEEAIAQYYVYAGIVKENISSRTSDIITKDFSISLLVMEWASLLNDILSTMEDGIVSSKIHDSSDNSVNLTLSSMLDTFINPMLNIICSASISSEKIPLTPIIRINNISYCSNIMISHHNMKPYLEKHIQISEQLIYDEKHKLMEILKDEFSSRYRFKELLEELLTKNSTDKTLLNEEQDPLLILSQVIIDHFFDTILRFDTIPFVNADRIQERHIRREILDYLYKDIYHQYKLIYDRIHEIWSLDHNFLKYDPDEVIKLFSEFLEDI